MKTKDETIADLLEYALELRHQWEWKRYEPRAGNQAEYDALNETIEQARQVLAQAANEPRQ